MSKKVLYLHGFGESELVAGMAAKDLKDTLTTAGYELLKVPDGFIPLKSKEECAPIVDPEYRKMVEAGDLEAFAWYPFVKGDTGGHRKPPFEDFEFRTTAPAREEAVKKLVALIDKLGGVDAIVGFSQGGELAYLLCEYLGRPGVSVKWSGRLKFIATFGSEDSFNQRGEAPAVLKQDTTFFIGYGEFDKDAVHDSQTAKTSLEKVGARKVVAHEIKGLDHHMPKKDAAGTAAYKLMVEEMASAFKPATVAPVAKKEGENYVDEKGILRFPDGRSVRALDDMMLDPNVPKFTWEIPPEAPPGWGIGKGEEWLIENCDLYRPEHPAWIKCVARPRLVPKHPNGLKRASWLPALRCAPPDSASLACARARLAGSTPKVSKRTGQTRRRRRRSDAERPSTLRRSPHRLITFGVPASWFTAARCARAAC